MGGSPAISDTSRDRAVLARWAAPVDRPNATNSGVDKLSSFLATAETLSLLRLDRSGFGALLGFANRPKNRFRAFVSAPRGQTTADKKHVPKEGFQPNRERV